MDRETLEKICEKIYKKFPEVSGKKPTVRPQTEDQILLIFNGQAATADGHLMPRTIRVVVSPTGKIIKTTTSR